MAQLGALSLQKGELLEALLVLPLSRLPRPMLLHKLALKEGDFPHKAVGVDTSRGKRCRILRLCSGHHSSASPSARAARSSESLIRRVALSCTVAASRAEILVASTAVARAASVAVMTSRAWATSAYRMVTFALP
jgi:hypothetical protein